MNPILFVTDGNFLSHLLRCMEIAKVLRARGEDVVFAASGRYVDMLGRNKFEYHPVFTNDPDHTMRATRASMFRYYNRHLLKKSVDSEIACLKKINPRVVVGDFRWTLGISAEYCGVPYVGIINTIWTPYYAPFRSISEKMLLRKIFGLKFMEKVSPYGQKLMMYRRGKPFNRLRKKLGITPRCDLNREMYGDYNLMPDIPEFCPTTGLPDNFQYIGPLFAKDDTLADYSNIKLPQRPYVYVTLGSTATPRMIQLIFDAFAGKNVPIVMSTGKQPIQLTVPDNFYVHDYLSAKQALKNAQTVVCHGGQGTLYQALSYGLPIIGIATHNDQQWNMDRVSALKLGIQFGEDSTSPDEIFKAYTTITANPEYRTNCMNIKKIIHGYDSLNLAADAVIRYAGQHKKERTEVLV